MANHKSSKKRIIRNANRALINGARMSRIRTFVKKVETAILEGDAVSTFFTKVRIRLIRAPLIKARLALRMIRFLEDL